jgi:adenosine/AMP kinase
MEKQDRSTIIKQCQTSCLNGKITAGHCFAIIANRSFPLSKALNGKDNHEIISNIASANK